MALRVQHELTYHELARRLLRKQTTEEIAQAMAMTPELVQQITHRQAFKNTMEKLRVKMYTPLDRELVSDARDIQAEIVEAAATSMTELRKLITGAKSESVRANVGQDFLDRAGYKPQPTEEPVVQIVVNPIDADILMTALKKEQEGEQRLKNRPELALAPEQLKHPLLKQNNGNNPSDKPTE